MRWLLVFLFFMMTFIGAGTTARCADQGKIGHESRSGSKTSLKHRRIPLILDTDIGDDIDDSWALGTILGSPEIDLRLIVTSTNDTAARTRLVAKTLERMGRTDVPIGTGVKTHQYPLGGLQKWLGNYTLKHYPGRVHADGIQAMIDCINAVGTTITICAIGPSTNLREALRRDPGIAKKARVVAMAGSVFAGYNGKAKPDSEYNVVADVEAARAVLAAPWDITWAPLDSCGTLRISGERYKRLTNSKAPRAATVMESYHHWVNRKDCPANESSVLFDTEAAYLCLGHDDCEMKTVKLRIDDKGFSVPDDKHGRPVHCALALKNRAALEEFIVKALTRP